MITRIVLVAALLWAGTVMAASTSTQDETFIKEASAGGLAEVALGNIGATKGTLTIVKVFGQTMVKDHTNANAELKALATSKGLSVAAEPTPEDQEAADTIKQLKGDEFNRQFAQKMVADHEKAIDLFQAEAASGQDVDVKAFAAKTLPILKHHLEMAKKLPGAPKV